MKKQNLTRNKKGIVDRPTNFFKRISFIFILSLFSAYSFSQMNAADLLGKYLVPSKDGAILVYEVKGKFFGKIILNKDPNKLDVNNPDKTKQSNKVLGMNILNNFVFDGDDTWENGTIYDPKNGKTYSCKITRLQNGDLNIRGFIGVSLFGRTETFTKLPN